MPADPNARAGRTYLSFDVANRSIAFTYARFSRPSAASVRELAELEQRAAALSDIAGDLHAGELDSMAADIARLDGELQPCCVLRAGSADLTAGRKVKDVPLIQRLAALRTFLRTVAPMPDEFPPGTEVLVELQMGPNAKSHEIECAILYHYAPPSGAHWTVRTVGAALKNTLAPAPDGELYHFVERYAKKYDANKAHALFNFNHLARVWNFDAAYAPPTCDRRHRKDLADSYMQALVVWIRAGMP